MQDYEYTPVYAMKPAPGIKFSQCVPPKANVLHWFATPQLNNNYAIAEDYSYGICPEREIAHIGDGVLHLTGCNTGVYGYGTAPSVATSPIAKGVPVRLTQEHVFVKCRDNPLHDEVNHFVLPIPTGGTPRTATAPHNVAIVMIDGVSHQQFETVMAETVRLLRTGLKSAQVFELAHVWVNGYNTQPNEPRQMCGDDCRSSHILKHFKDAGFKTWWSNEYPNDQMGYPFGDDGASSADHLLAGQYYGKMFDHDNVNLYSYRLNKAGKHYGVPPGCVHQRHSINNLMQYMDEMLLAYKPVRDHDLNGGRLAIIGSAAQGHSDVFMQLKTCDRPIADFFKAIDARSSNTRGGGAGLDNTIVFIMSDHGIHGTPLNRWWAGEYEHRNPVWKVVVPNAILQKYPEVAKVLEANSRRMVAHWDTYCTLKSLAGNLDELLTRANANKVHPQRGPRGCYNLLTEVVPDSTCSERGIPEVWCNCWVPRP